MASGAVGADVSDDAEGDIFCGDTLRQFAFDGDAEGLGPAIAAGTASPLRVQLQKCRCRRQARQTRHGAGVAVAADDGHAGFRQSEFRSNDVHDALVGRLNVVELDAELGAVAAQRVDLLCGDSVFNDEPVWCRRNIMVHRGHGAIGTPDVCALPAAALRRPAAR